jgi:hypothetical protein
VNQAKCTTCGAGLAIKKGDKTTVCVYCQTTNIVKNALALGKVEVDVTEDIIESFVVNVTKQPNIQNKSARG